MKRFLILIILTGIFTSSCEKRRFGQASGFSESGNYEINQAGAFSETATFSLQETLDALDLPDLTSVDSVSIKSISIKGVSLTGNEATSITLQGTVTYAGETRNLFSSNQLTVSSSGIQEIALSNLNPGAINLLKKFMTATVYSFFGFPVGAFNLTDSFFTVNIIGTPSPAPSSQINMSLELVISFDLSYAFCVDALFLLGDNC